MIEEINQVQYVLLIVRGKLHHRLPHGLTVLDVVFLNFLIGYTYKRVYT